MTGYATTGQILIKRKLSMEDKLRKVTVLLDEREFLRFESYCDEKGFKKSTLAARLIREHLNREAFNPQRQLPLLSPTGQE